MQEWCNFLTRCHSDKIEIPEFFHALGPPAPPRMILRGGFLFVLLYGKLVYRLLYRRPNMADKVIRLSGPFTRA